MGSVHLPPLLGIDVALMLETCSHISTPAEKAWHSCFLLRLQALNKGIFVKMHLNNK